MWVLIHWFEIRQADRSIKRASQRADPNFKNTEVYVTGEFHFGENHLAQL